MLQKIKTRFAPSPTGEMHIGNLRSALFAYLFARHNHGEFILRIEDTDQSRYQEGSVEMILESLKWSGLNYDGEITYQSKRLDIYKKYAEQLVAAGHAYYCFCETEVLETMRSDQQKRGVAPKYDQRCLKLSPQEVEEKLKNNQPKVIRMKIPDGMTVFKDLIRAEVGVNNCEIDDQVLLKSDGYPTYHLANVVDDHEMGITHVIRAEEWLPSTPKHVILYQMFGWTKPEFAHLPMILAPDKSKLSKRHGATSVMEFKKLGYLPEALINYIALLGWNPGTEQEIFSLAELVKEFDLNKVNKAGAVFDINKLDWINGYYIRQKNIDELTKLCTPYLLSAGYKEDFDYFKAIVALEQERLKKLSEIGEKTKYFFVEPKIRTDILSWKKSTLAEAKKILEFLKTELEKVPDENWTRNALEEYISQLIKTHGLGAGNTLWPLRVALTGEEKSPGPFEVAEVLGKAETLKRIRRVIY